MYRCLKCERSFETQRALNAHQVAYKSGERYVSRGERSTFKCEHCEVEAPTKPSTKNRFCSKLCEVSHRSTEWNRRIEAGEVLGFKAMRSYLIERDNRCQECGVSDTYNSKPIVLQCDHIDGNNDNHKLSNLRLLCPNCHSQTETWCGRNKKDTKRNKYLREYRQKCPGRALVDHRSLQDRVW